MACSRTSLPFFFFTNYLQHILWSLFKWKLFWVKRKRWLKAVPMGSDAGIPLTHRLMDPLPNKSLGCCCTTKALMSLSNLNVPFCAFLNDPNVRKSHSDKPRPVGRMLQCLPVCPVQCEPNGDKRCHAIQWYPSSACQDTFFGWWCKGLESFPQQCFAVMADNLGHKGTKQQLSAPVCMDSEPKCYDLTMSPHSCSL
jgi:hypothetical protein